MDELSVLDKLFEKFKERLTKAPPAKKSEAIKKAISSLKASIKLVEPTQRDLKQELLTDKTAIKIRSLWNDAKKAIDLNAMARELGLTLKRPTIDHVMLGYYYPERKLEELAKRLEAAVANDPERIEIQQFQEWRGRLRAMNREDDIARGVQRLVEEQGEPVVRRFAVHLKTKDASGRRKLPKTASLSKVIDAVATQLWKERMVSKAQEGVR